MFPEKIDDTAWVVLLQCETRKQRLDHIIFLRKKENLRKKESERQRERQEHIEEREPLTWKPFINWNEARVGR